MSLYSTEMGDHLEIYKKIISMIALHLFFKWLTFAPHKHESKVKAVRLNGQINQVKQP